MPSIGKLVPLSGYNKPLLQLTNTDKAKIAELTGIIRGYQYRLQPFEDKLRIPWMPESEKAICRFHIADITKEIQALQQEIRNIKVERYREQLNLLV